MTVAEWLKSSTAHKSKLLSISARNITVTGNLPELGWWWGGLGTQQFYKERMGKFFLSRDTEGSLAPSRKFHLGTEFYHKKCIIMFCVGIHWHTLKSVTANKSRLLNSETASSVECCWRVKHRHDDNNKYTAAVFNLSIFCWHVQKGFSLCIEKKYSHIPLH